jgi:sporulation protein YlmC with PRC-barrel domain
VWIPQLCSYAEVRRADLPPLAIPSRIRYVATLARTQAELVSFCFAMVRKNRGEIMQNTSVATGSNSNLIDSKRVEGTRVFDPTGKHIGAIKRLVLDKTSGRVVYTIAQFGGFLGMGGDEYTIPWNKLNYDTTLGGYVTNVTEEQLKGAPDYGRNPDDNWFDRNNERTLNDHYGSQYYWSE